MPTLQPGSWCYSLTNFGIDVTAIMHLAGILERSGIEVIIG